MGSKRSSKNSQDFSKVRPSSVSNRNTKPMKSRSRAGDFSSFAGGKRPTRSPPHKYILGPSDVCCLPQLPNVCLCPSHALYSNLQPPAHCPFLHLGINRHIHTPTSFSSMSHPAFPPPGRTNKYLHSLSATLNVCIVHPTPPHKDRCPPSPAPAPLACTLAHKECRVFLIFFVFLARPWDQYKGPEVEYFLRAIPAGGYVTFPDDDPKSGIQSSPHPIFEIRFNLDNFY